MIVLMSILAALTAGLLIWVLSSSPAVVAQWRRWETFANELRSRGGGGFSPVGLALFLVVSVVGCSYLTAKTGSAYWLLPALLVLIYPWYMHWKLDKVRKEQLSLRAPDIIRALANAIAVSGNVNEAFASVASVETDPWKTELKRVLAEVQLGTTMDDAVQNLAQRVPLAAIESMATALTIGRRSGGNLSQVLTEIAASATEIQRLEGMLKSKTAESRGQLVLMMCIGPGLCLVLNWLQPGWLTPLFHTLPGIVLLAFAILCQVAGIAWAYKIMQVDF